MKINNIGHIYKILETYHTQLKQTAKNTRVRPKNTLGEEKNLLEISPEAKELQMYRQKLADLELKVRPEVVNTIQQQIKEGTFAINEEKIATGLIEEWQPGYPKE